MFEGLDVLESREGEQEEQDRQRCQHSKRNVKTAVELQPRAAMAAVGEVLFVIPAHLRRNPGDVISPASQDGAYDVIITSGSSHSFVTHSKKLDFQGGLAVAVATMAEKPCSGSMLRLAGLIHLA